LCHQPKVTFEGLFEEEWAREARVGPPGVQNENAPIAQQLRYRGDYQTARGLQ